MIVHFTYHDEQGHFYEQSLFGIHYTGKPFVALHHVRAVVSLLISGFLGVEGRYHQSHQGGSLLASVTGSASLSVMDIACRCPCHSCVPWTEVLNNETSVLIHEEIRRVQRRFLSLLGRLQHALIVDGMCGRKVNFLLPQLQPQHLLWY